MSGPIACESTTLHVPAVRGDGVNLGIVGVTQDGWAVSGESKKQIGVRGVCEDGWGVSGESKTQVGVRGVCEPGWGVAGDSMSGVGVRGTCKDHIGVAGESINGTGVYGKSSAADGSRGQAGVVGEFDNGVGVFGRSTISSGVGGMSRSGIGIHGVSDTGEGVRADTNSLAVAAIAGFNNNPEGTGAAIYGKKAGTQGHAGFFEGNVHVTGDITLTNADCAEHFDVAIATIAEPGTVMVVGEEGVLHQCCQPYDKRVAGVVSGAGDYKPGIVLDKQPSQEDRKPIALLGKVYCKADASHMPIEVGDLLTTSKTPGHAMKAADVTKSFGAVIGKALRPLAEGQALIPILIALQ